MINIRQGTEGDLHLRHLILTDTGIESKVSTVRVTRNTRVEDAQGLGRLLEKDQRDVRGHDRRQKKEKEEERELPRNIASVTAVQA